MHVEVEGGRVREEVLYRGRAEEVDGRTELPESIALHDGEDPYEADKDACVHPAGALWMWAAMTDMLSGKPPS